MRRIPGFDGWNGCRSVDVGVPDHGCPLGTRRPVLASAVVRAIERRTIRLRSRENVVPVRLFSVAVDRLTLFGQCRSLADIVAAVQLSEIFCDHHPLGILPGPLPDAIACISGRRPVGGLLPHSRGPRLSPGPPDFPPALALIAR